jgi:hypothetical protein
MSYFIVHLKVAEAFLSSTDTVRDKAAFYLGCLAPDAIMFRPGCLRSDKTLTHFCVGGEGWGYHTNYIDWTESLRKNVRTLTGTIDDDFLLGWFAHIFTDIQNTERFWTPNRLNPAPGHLERFLRDCAEIDSRLMKDLRDRALITAALENPTDFTLPGVLEPGDLQRLSHAYFRMYGHRSPNRRYAYNVITDSDIRAFINSTAGLMAAQYQGFFA